MSLSVPPAIARYGPNGRWIRRWSGWVSVDRVELHPDNIRKDLLESDEGGGGRWRTGDH